MWSAKIDKVANGYIVQCMVGRPLVDRNGRVIEGRVMIAKDKDEAAQHAMDFADEVEQGRPATPADLDAQERASAHNAPNGKPN
jgi:hypothetical protein